jgi:hypothetical protein
MLPAPMSPSPPALLTALASRHPLAQTIPAWMIGNSIPKRLQILFERKVKSQKSKVKKEFFALFAPPCVLCATAFKGLAYQTAPTLPEVNLRIIPNIQTPAQSLH